MKIKLTPAERRLLQDVAAMKGEIELPRLGEIHRLVSSSNLLLRRHLNEIAVLLVIRLLRNTDDMHTIKHARGAAAEALGIIDEKINLWELDR